MPTGRYPFAAVGAAVLATVFSACSSERGTSRAADAGGAGATAGDEGPNGSLFGAGGGDGGSIFSTAPGSVTLGDGSTCAADSRTARRLPLDMYIMMDASGSMLEPTPQNSTKWEAVGNAILDFVTDPRSQGIHVALNFFPQMKDGVPVQCTTHAECGSGGPCATSFCRAPGPVQFCATDADCGSGVSCVPLGVCRCDSTLVCELGAGRCGAGCPCVDPGAAWCVNGTKCSPSAYETPSVDFVAVPAGASQLVDAMNALSDFGRTPTGPALAGALDYAAQRAGDNGGHPVVVVLATDGLPTECDEDIPQVARIAARGASSTPSIPSYVVGVFGPLDPPEASSNLDEIAQAGDTSSAFIVDASGDVTQQFTDALDSIRGRALSCEFEIPKESSGALDYLRVNLRFSSAGQDQQLVYVRDASRCTADGWYYDTDPADSAPTKIVVCPEVCTAFENAPDAEVSIQIGCATVVR